MSLYDERIADLKEIEPDVPNTFQHGTGGSQVSGPCIPSGARKGKVLEVGGKLVTIRQVIFIRSELFTAGDPEQMQPIKFKRDSDADYTEYRIAEARQTSEKGNWELDLTGLDEL